MQLWAAQTKMDKAAWAKPIPQVKEAADDGTGGAAPTVWQDNERALLQPDVYADHGLELVRAPPSSGDINPIETVWACLRKDLAQREMTDLTAGKPPQTVEKFRARAAQILRPHSAPKVGESRTRLGKLVRGMPGQLRD